MRSRARKRAVLYRKSETALTSPLDLVRLPPLMERSLGIRQVRIGLIDGPILTSHPDVSAERMQPIGPNDAG